MFNRETHKSRGFGFIVFVSEQGADLVCNEKEHIIDGKVVRLICISTLRLTFVHFLTFYFLPLRLCLLSICPLCLVCVMCVVQVEVKRAVPRSKIGGNGNNSGSSTPSSTPTTSVSSRKSALHSPSSTTSGSPRTTRKSSSNNDSNKGNVFILLLLALRYIFAYGDRSLLLFSRWQQSGVCVEKSCQCSLRVVRRSP